MSLTTVRFMPTAMIYLDGSVLLSSETIGVTSTTSPASHVIASTASKINAAITEINTYYWLYGYSVSPGIPALPTLPVANANPPGNMIFYQSSGVGGTSLPQGTGLSRLCIDRGNTSGYSDPASALDIILSEPNLGNINQALINIAAGKS